MSYLKKKRRVSIIMGIFNCAKTLPEAIDSIISQTFTDWELIMCDDGSSDETISIASSYVECYDNVLLLRNGKNCGLPATLNHCLEYADSEYIARMDGDDISLPKRLEKEVLFLDSHPEFALVSCSMICFDDIGDWGYQGNVAEPKKIDFAYKSPFCHAPCMMRRSVLSEVGNYTVREGLRRGQDYYLWHKFYRAGYRGYNIQEPLYKMRDGRDAAKRRTLRSAINGCKSHIEVMRNLGLPTRLYYRAFRGVLVSLIPAPIYIRLHKRRIRKEAESLRLMSNGPKRVLQILGSLSGGGVESFILNVYRNIDREQIQFDFVVNTSTQWVESYAEEIERLGGKIYKYPLSLLGLNKYFQLLKNRDYIAVHCHRGESSPIFLCIARIAKIKTRVCHSHSTMGGNKLAVLLKRPISHMIPLFATDLLACGEEAGRWLYGSKVFKVIYNGVDLNRFICREEVGDDVRKEFQISDNQLVFGHLGRIEKPKNHSFLLKVFAEILKREPSALLFDIGDGSLRASIENESRLLGLADSIRFLGNRSDVERLIQCWDCAIFPSLYEGFSVAMVELQSASVPILASDNIPHEIAVVQGLIEFQSLNSSVSEWAIKAINMAKGNTKLVRDDSIMKSGLDIANTCEQLMSVYLSQ